MSSAVETLGGENAVLTEKESVACEKLPRCFPDAKIFDDTDDDPEWGKFERKPGAAIGLTAGPPCQPFAPTGKGKLDDAPRA